MARYSWTRPLHIALIVAVALSAGAVTAITVPQPETHETEPPSVYIAPKRIGDAVSYEGTIEDRYRFGGCENSHSRPLRDGHRIAEPRMITVGDGRRVAALALDLGNHLGWARPLVPLPLWGPPPVCEELYDAASTGVPYVSWDTVYIDMGARDAVRSDRYYGDDDIAMTLMRMRGMPSAVPEPLGPHMFWGNMTLTYGDEFGPEEHDWSWLDQNITWLFRHYDNVAYYDKVDSMAMIDGELALGRTGRFVYEGSDEDGTSWGGWDEERMWFVDGLPHPVRYEASGHFDYGNGDFWEYNHVAAMVSSESGDQDIPWGQVASVLQPAPSVHRGVSMESVPDLAGIPLDYPLQDAIDAMDEDPKLLDLQAWRARFPGAWVAGVEYHSDLEGRGPAWLISLAASPRDAFMVLTQRPHPMLPAINLERSTEGYPWLGAHAFEADRMGRPSEAVPITFATAADLAATVIDPARVAQGPTWLRWGQAPGAMQPHDFVAWEAQSPIQMAFGPTELERQTEGGVVEGVIIDGLEGRMVTAWARQAPPDFEELANGVGEQHFEQAVPMDPGQRVVPIDGRDSLALAGAVSGTLLGLMLLGYFWQALRFGASGAAIAGFSRISRAQVEEQPTREKVANAVRADPGITPMEMQKALGLTYSTIVYHLRVLEREGIVNSVTDGRYRRFFATADVDAGKRGAMSALRNPRTRNLFDLITGRPGIPHRQLAKHAGISRPAVYWHMERLQAAGLVGRERMGHAVCYYPLETPGVSDVA